MDDLVERLRNFEGSGELGDGDFSLMIEAADALGAAGEDAARWRELCRQIDEDEIHSGIFDDAKHMGAGALEMHIDAAR